MRVKRQFLILEEDWMVFRFQVWGVFILRKRKLTRSLHFTKIQMIQIVYAGVHLKMILIKVFFFIHCVIDLLFLFFVPVSFTVFTVKELEKLPNLKVESPPKEIEELNRKGTSDWQCQEKSKRDLCEETLLKIRYRVNERRILIKQFFKDYDRYAYFYFIAYYMHIIKKSIFLIFIFNF